MANSLPNIPDKALAEKTRRALKLASIGYWALLISLILNLLVFYPGEGNQGVISLVVWLTPLLFPMPGIIKQHPYTFAWANFISAIYICRALTNFYLYPGEWPASLLELAFSIMWFTAGSFFARWRGMELGLELKKLSADKNNAP